MISHGCRTILMSSITWIAKGRIFFLFRIPGLRIFSCFPNIFDSIVKIQIRKHNQEVPQANRNYITSLVSALDGNSKAWFPLAPHHPQPPTHPTPPPQIDRFG